MPIYVSKGGGGGTDDDAIHDNVAGEIAAIAEKTAPVAADMLLIEDTDAANAKKRVQFDNLFMPDVSVCVYNSANTDINNNSETTFTAWDLEHWDTDAMHNPASNPERLTCVRDGRYLVWGTLKWEDDADGIRRAQILTNGGTGGIPADVSPGGWNSYGSVAGVYDLDVGDYVYLSVYQSSGDVIYIYAGASFGMLLLADA